MITTAVNVGELNVVAVFLHEENPSNCLIGSFSLNAIVDMAATRRISFSVGIDVWLSCQQVACVVADCIQKQKSNSMQYFIC